MFPCNPQTPRSYKLVLIQLSIFFPQLKKSPQILQAKVCLKLLGNKWKSSMKTFGEVAAQSQVMTLESESVMVEIWKCEDRKKWTYLTRLPHLCCYKYNISNWTDGQVQCQIIVNGQMSWGVLSENPLLWIMYNSRYRMVDILRIIRSEMGKHKANHIVLSIHGKSWGLWRLQVWWKTYLLM